MMSIRYNEGKRAPRITGFRDSLGLDSTSCRHRAAGAGHIAGRLTGGGCDVAGATTTIMSRAIPPTAARST